MASVCFALRNSALPDSRNLVICAERLGLTGMGGGGMGDSMVRRHLCRSFKLLSSSWRARELEAEVIALEVGSR